MGSPTNCRKVRYGDRRQASNAMKHLIKAGKLRPQSAPYLCKSCGGWHWGRYVSGNVNAAIDAALAKDLSRKHDPEAR